MENILLRIPPKWFFGTQAIYYPERVREGFSEYLKRDGVDTLRRPYDFLVREYAQEENIPMFVLGSRSKLHLTLVLSL